MIINGRLVKVNENAKKIKPQMFASQWQALGLLCFKLSQKQLKRLIKLMTKKTLSLMSATLFILMFANCSKKANPVNVINIINDPKIFYCWLQVPTQNAVLYSDPITDPSNTTVTMIWGSHNQMLLSNISNGQMNFYSDSGHYFGDTTITIKITSDSDTGIGCIQVPSGTSLLTPAEHDTLPIDSVKCIWTKAERADWYKIYSHSYALDSSGCWAGTIRNIDTFLFDTTFTIPLSYFSVPNAIYYQIQLMVEPYAGPQMIPNSEGNISGDIKGFLYGIGNAGGSNFCVDTRLKMLRLNGSNINNKETNNVNQK
ncbi:hypothetical protein HZA73_09435 [candidate division TA06 bacterium]|nr:hypothetical protein [candidate division TA06 bacterium]